MFEYSNIHFNTKKFYFINKYFYFLLTLINVSLNNKIMEFNKKYLIRYI